MKSYGDINFQGNNKISYSIDITGSTDKTILPDIEYVETMITESTSVINNSISDISGLTTEMNNTLLTLTGSSSSSSWGNITGTLTNQTDLSNILNLEMPAGNIWTLISEISMTSGYEIITNENGSLILIMQQDGRIDRSIDSGLTFTQVRNADSIGISSSAYGNNIYVVSTETGYFLYSNDNGLTWNQSANINFTAQWKGITYGSGKFVAVSSNKSQIGTSSDGINWNLVDTTFFAWAAVLFDGTKFVATSQNNTDNIAISTDSGSTWNIYGSGIAGCDKIAYDGNTYMICRGGSGDFAYSTDAQNWTLSVMTGSFGIGEIIGKNGMFIIVSNGSNTGQKIWISTDHTVTWINGTYPRENNMQDICIDSNGTFYTVGTQASSDGPGVFKSKIEILDKIETYKSQSDVSLDKKVDLDIVTRSVYSGHLGSTNKLDSVSLGYQSGFDATYAQNIVFIGSGSGYGAENVNHSVFIGVGAGSYASGASETICIGQDAGQSATDAIRSTFIGNASGNNATYAHNSTFIGQYAGYNATNASSSIFIGNYAGYDEQLIDNNINNTYSILLGPYTSTGGYKNSIAIGSGATNTSEKQLVIGSSTTGINNVKIFGPTRINLNLAGSDPTPTSDGEIGEMRIINGYVYFHTGTNTWVRTKQETTW